MKNTEKEEIHSPVWEKKLHREGLFEWALTHRSEFGREKKAFRLVGMSLHFLSYDEYLLWAGS